MNRVQITFIFAFLLLALAHVAQGQVLKPISWTYEVSAGEVQQGQEVDLVFKAQIKADWYLYSSDFDPDLGPKVTTFTFQKHPSYTLVGPVKPIGAKKKFDDIFGGEYTYFTKTAEFRQRIKVLQPVLVVQGAFEYQVCTDVDGKCIPFEDDFVFDQIKVLPASATATNAPVAPTTKVAPAPAANLQSEPQAPVAATPADRTDLTGQPELAAQPVDTTLAQATPEATADPGEARMVPVAGTSREGQAAGPLPQSLWAFALMAFGAGFLALLTPCVFPMVPMTVSFFTGSSASRGQAILKGVGYGLSIIVIYTLAGVIVSRFMGPETANFLSTHWLPNVLFFLVFLFFGMSFLGLFEITLPGWLLNKTDAQADKGGWIGIFFMAFTLVLVSFSCTGPIVGSILVASAGGETLKPITGMAAYSLAFALPFALFAIFPSWLSGLPKSGGWLNSVKVCLGFIELALALKFLSMADQAYHWRLLDREVYLAFWIVIFSLMGFYLLGKLKFSHDSDLPYLSVPRLFVAIITFAFVVYLIPGLFGAPLKALAGYLPPQSSLDFDLQAAGRGQAAVPVRLDERCEPPKYADILHLPHGLQGYFDLEQARRCAQALNKPIFIDFTGHACVNCREMEARVWSDPEVLKRLREDYVVVALYVDDKLELPESAWYTSAYDQKVKKTLGKQNADYQITAFNNNAQPYYVLMDATGRVLAEPSAYNLNAREFADFLDRGVAAFQNREIAPGATSMK